MLFQHGARLSPTNAFTIPTLNGEGGRGGGGRVESRWCKGGGGGERGRGWEGKRGGWYKWERKEEGGRTGRERERDNILQDLVMRSSISYKFTQVPVPSSEMLPWVHCPTEEHVFGVITVTVL